MFVGLTEANQKSNVSVMADTEHKGKCLPALGKKQKQANKGNISL